MDTLKEKPKTKQKQTEKKAFKNATLRSFLMVPLQLPHLSTNRVDPAILNPTGEQSLLSSFQITPLFSNGSIYNDDLQCKNVCQYCFCLFLDVAPSSSVGIVATSSSPGTITFSIDCYSVGASKAWF